MAAITRGPIDERALERAVASPASGAMLTFVGVVRNEHLGRAVTAIEYHAYESMALRELSRIEDAIVIRWPSVRAAIAHRIGHLNVGEASVFIAVSAAHRAEGFEGLRFAIESIKKDVPIWKKELYADGGYAWIEGS
jgi:molybdopterin synthase catalytic subunit